MDWKAWIGPATLVYVISVSVAGVWWASDLTTRISAAEKQVTTSAGTAERIVRLEVLITHLDSQLNRIENKLDRDRTAGGSSR